MATLPINPALSFATPPGLNGTKPTTSNSLTNENAFLKLLVAQIQHQDPLNPTDGVQFLTQLTSFSQLEQLMQINQELAPQVAPVTDPTSSQTNPVG